MQLTEALDLLQKYPVVGYIDIREIAGLHVRDYPRIRWEIQVSEEAFRAVCAASVVPYTCEPHTEPDGRLVGHSWHLDIAPDLCVTCYKHAPRAA